MHDGWKVLVAIAAIIIIGEFAHGLIRGETHVGQTDDIERKLDRMDGTVKGLTVQQDLRSYAAFLLSFCEEQERGFPSLACVHWTEQFIREIAAPGYPQQRLKIPNRPGGCDIPGCLPRPQE